MMANKISNKYLRVTDRLVKRINKIKQLAIAYKKLTNRDLNVADEIGKVLIANGLGFYLLKNSKDKGHTAIDSNGNKVKIITGEIADVKNLTANIIIELSHKANFDYMICVLLDKKYNIAKTNTVTYQKLKCVFDNKQEVSIGEFFRM